MGWELIVSGFEITPCEKKNWNISFFLRKLKMGKLIFNNNLKFFSIVLIIHWKFLIDACSFLFG